MGGHHNKGPPVCAERCRDKGHSMRVVQEKGGWHKHVCACSTYWCRHQKGGG